MRKEFGKWLMDIAKYITTAVVLSSVFGKVDSWIMYILAIVSVTATLLIGLHLVSDNTKRKNNYYHRNKRK